MAAGGVINPVTGRWAVKSWRIDDLLPVAEQTYRSIENRFGISIYHPLPMRRYCLNAEDAKRIGRRLRNPRYADVLGSFREAGEAGGPIDDPYGSYTIKKTAYVDLPSMLLTLRSHYKWINRRFRHDCLERAPEGWRYEGIRARRVFFCEGADRMQNPLTKNLPIQPIKGETLLLKNKALQLPQGLLHHKKWILSHGDGRFRIGSTYDEKDRSPLPTEKGANDLIHAMQDSMNGSFQMLGHTAGLRPTTPDTRPIVGALPGNEGLYILNGLGSKGVSVAPLICRQLVAQIKNRKPLDPEIDILRFEQTGRPL